MEGLSAWGGSNGVGGDGRGGIAGDGGGLGGSCKEMEEDVRRGRGRGFKGCGGLGVCCGERRVGSV